MLSVRNLGIAKHWARIAATGAILMLGAVALARAQSPKTDRDTYTWFGEFVSLDPTAMKMTVKSRVAYEPAVSELKQFKPGQSVWIVWSGVLDYSDAVRQVRSANSSGTIDENLVLPAELVGTDASNQFVTIRVRVPESSLAALKTLKAGEWVTVTSRHRPATEADAVVAVAPYGGDSTTTQTLSSEG
jgi:hypothetical protein